MRDVMSGNVARLLARNPKPPQPRYGGKPANSYVGSQQNYMRGHGGSAQILYPRPKPGSSAPVGLRFNPKAKLNPSQVRDARISGPSGFQVSSVLDTRKPRRK